MLGGATGDVVLLGTAVLVEGTTYRYEFTGDFVPGEVDVTIVAGTFEVG